MPATAAAIDPNHNYFKGMREAKTSDRLPYIEAEQKFKLKLVKTFVFGTRTKGDAFIANFEILESSSTTQKVGTQVAWYQGLDKDNAFGSIKLLLYAVLGLDPKNADDAKKIADEVDPKIEDEMNTAVRTNHLAGATLGVQTFTRLSKEGKPYTVHNWYPA